LLRSWADEYPQANIGLLTRERPTVDIDDESVFSIVAPLLPVTRHVKRGRRGWSYIFSQHPTDPVRSRSFLHAQTKQTLLEVLGPGKQTVLPPSIHPDTGQPYVWCDGYVPLDMAIPAPLSATDVLQIEYALRAAGLLTAPLERKIAADDQVRGNEDRYRKFYQVRLADKLGQIRGAGQGNRQQVLNDALVSLAPGYRVGVLAYDEIWEGVVEASAQNGYLQERGEKMFLRDVSKALEEGMAISELSDLGERRGAASPAPPDAPPPTINPRKANDVLQEAPRPREWTVEGWFPHKQVSLVYGDGGIGKTTLLMQLGICAARGGMWLGHMCAKRKVLFISAEDEQAEMDYRLHEMSKAYGRDMSGFEVLSLADMQDCELAQPGERGRMCATKLCELIEMYVRSGGHDMLIFDPVADLFGGNEVDKRQVVQFMRLLRKRFAFDLGCTVIVAAHPSSDGLRSGRGTSGSTAWSNGSRSRLYFRRCEKDASLVELEVMKANRSKVGTMLTMRWVEGVFVVSQSVPAGIDPEIQRQVFAELERRNFFYCKSHLSPDWVGHMMGPIMSIDQTTREGKKKVTDLLHEWDRMGLINFAMTKGTNRHEKPVIELIM
jgi:archaellum biogenesis ATPase FlaH